MNSEPSERSSMEEKSWDLSKNKENKPKVCQRQIRTALIWTMFPNNQLLRMKPQRTVKDHLTEKKSKAWVDPGDQEGPMSIYTSSRGDLGWVSPKCSQILFLLSISKILLLYSVLDISDLCYMVSMVDLTQLFVWHLQCLSSLSGWGSMNPSISTVCSMFAPSSGTAGWETCMIFTPPGVLHP